MPRTSDPVDDSVSRLPATESGRPERAAAVARVDGQGLDYGGHCRRCGIRHSIGPSPEAEQAARDLLRRLDSAERLPSLPGAKPGPAIAPRFAPGGGQMIGVLVAQGPDGERRVLKAFSGQWDGLRGLPGWAPPLAFADGEPEWKTGGEARLDLLGEAIEQARKETARLRQDLRARLAEAEAESAERVQALLAQRGRSRERRARRRVELETRLTEAGMEAGSTEAARLALEQRALDDESRREKRILRDQRAADRALLDSLRQALDRVDQPASRLKRERRELSRSLMARIHAAYRVPDRRGRQHPLREAFLEAEAIPSGAGDCCAPKLLAWAARLGLEPLGLVELWLGEAPRAGGRQHGQVYGACDRLCAPLLGFMLCPRPGVDRGPDGQPASEPGVDEAPPPAEVTP